MNPLLGNIYLANFHAHTPRCMHAVGTEEEYILQAIDAGFDALGFADHTAWPYRSDFVSGMRMPLSQLEGYLATVRSLAEKYADRIRVYAGLECEAFPEYYGWLAALKREKKVDYLILGNHYDTNDETGGFYFGKCRKPEEIHRYVETTIGGMESGLFAYLAHPDLFLHSYPEFDATAAWASREICRAAHRLNMPLEYNLLGAKRGAKDRARGAMGYTSDAFWDIAAEEDVRAIIGVDAHEPEAMNCIGDYASARKKLADLGIEILEALPGFAGSSEN